MCNWSYEPLKGKGYEKIGARRGMHLGKIFTTYLHYGKGYEKFGAQRGNASKKHIFHLFTLWVAINASNLWLYKNQESCKHTVESKNTIYLKMQSIRNIKSIDAHTFPQNVIILIL